MKLQVREHFLALVGAIILVVNLPTSARAQQDTSWLEGWDFRRSLEIDATQVDQDLTDFPLMVRLTPGIIDFNAVLPSGHDIRFTANDGVTLFSYELEEYDPLQAKAVYWVRIPTVSATTNIPFFVYWGNNQAVDASNPAGTWDENYMAVWHLAATNGETQPDSTSNAYDLNVYGDVVEGENGVMGGSVALSGSSADPQYLASQKGSTYPTFNTIAGITYSAWAHPTTTDEGTIIAVGGVNWPSYWLTYMGYYHDTSDYLRANSGAAHLAAFPTMGTGAKQQGHSL